MEHNIDLIKQIREAYAKEEGYKSFASMATNVNIVPRDISQIAKQYAAAMNAALQARCDRYEKALKDIVKNGENVRATYKTKNKPFYITIANEAISGEGEKAICDCTPAFKAAHGECYKCPGKNQKEDKQ